MGHFSQLANNFTYIEVSNKEGLQMKILKKVELRNEPMIRYDVLTLNESEKDVIFDKFFKGSYLTGSLSNGIVSLCKAKSARTLAIDFLDISKVDITRVVNNCGLDQKTYLQVTTHKSGTYGDTVTIDYYNYIV